MDLTIELSKDYEVISSYLTGTVPCNKRKFGENTEIIIISDKRLWLVIRDEAHEESYVLSDFCDLIFYEDSTDSKYSIYLHRNNVANNIVRYLKWRKVKYTFVDRSKGE